MPFSSSQQSSHYDAIVVGASFAGLSFASVAATLGMRVLVLERDSKVGGIVRTTGVLFSDVLDFLDVPDRYLMNAVRRIHMQPPDHAPLEISSSAYRFYMADVTGMLRWMAEQAQEHGATIHCDTMFLDATQNANGLMNVEVSQLSVPGKLSTLSTNILIGADGTRSRVARCMGLEQNTRYLAGAEWLLEGIPLDRETFYLIMNHELAPGYCLWLAPHGEIAAMGVAGHSRTFNPTTSLRKAQELFREVVDMSQARVVERKAGIIPTGGRLRHVYRHDKLGHALLLGDAAGLCGAATGGGIYPALISGRLAAHAVANEVMNATSGSIQAYLHNISQAGRLGHYLRIEDWLRLALDNMKSDADVSMLYGLFASPEGHKILQSALLETPIIGMDSSFFSLLRSLLSKHPRIYRSAFQAVWQRVIASNKA
ncbi:MAG: FAD-dependent monooxygenase [Ktedonobacteraceae bacterium]|nr:FAD-dependent monooxygenase [Ktedonobacteraceae bacterium]